MASPFDEQPIDFIPPETAGLNETSAAGAGSDSTLDFPTNAVAQHASNSEALMSGVASSGMFATEALVAGTVSLYNSAKEIGNFFTPKDEEGKDFFERTDTRQLFASYDEKWGEFYDKNKGAVDITGDMAALFVPGTIALKLVKGAATGNRMLKAFDLFQTANKRKEFIAAAGKAQVAGQVASELLVQNLKTAGFAAMNESAVISGLSFVMMNDSSLYEDYSAKSFVSDTLFGTALIGPMKFLGAKYAVRDLKVRAELGYNAANPVRGVTAVETKDITTLSLLEDADAASDPTRATALRNQAKKEFAGLIRAGEHNDLVVNRLTGALDSMSAEDFKSSFGGTSEIRLFDPGKDVDLTDPRNIRTYLEQRNLIKREGARDSKIDFYAIVPDKGKGAIKKSKIFGQEVYLNPAGSAQDEALALLGPGFKMQKFSTRGSNLFTPTKNLLTQVDVEGKPLQRAGVSIFAPRRIDFTKAKLAGRSAQDFITSIKAGELKAPETYMHMDLKTGKAVESGFQTTAGDLGLKFNDSLTRIDLGDSRFLAGDELRNPDFSYLEAAPEKIESLRLLTMERAKKAPEKFFALTNKEKDAFLLANKGKTLPDFALSSSDLLETEAAYALSVSGESVPMRVGNEIKLVTRTEIEKHLTDTKKSLLDQIDVAAFPADDLEVRLGIDTAEFLGSDGQKGFSTYGNISDLKIYKAPRHLTVIRHLDDFPSRPDMLSAMDIEAQRLAQQQSLLTSLQPVWTGILDLTHLGRLSSKLVTSQTESAGLFRGASGEELASVASYAETNGSLVNKAAEVLNQRILKPLVTFLEPVKKDPRKLEEFNFLYNRIRGLSADFETVYDLDGSARLKNVENGEILTRADDPSKEFIISPDVAKLHRAFQEGPVAQFIQFNNSRVQAVGRGKLLEPRIAYYPGQDLKKSPFTAFVTSPNGQKRTLTASTAELLQEKIALVRQQIPAVEINTLKEVKDVAKMYEDVSASDIFDDVEFDSALKRSGAFASFDQPLNTNVLEDLVGWMGQTSNKWIRRTASDVLAQEFYELRFLGDTFDNVEKSTVAGLKPEVFRKGNPFHDVIKTSLNISKYNEYETLSRVNQTVEGLVSKAVNSFRGSLAKTAGTADEINDANAARDNLRRAAGIDFDYSDPIARALANKRISGTELKTIVSRTNNVVGSLALAWDVLQPIINAISWPMLAWPELSAMKRKLGNPALQAQADSLLHTKVPGTQTNLPTPLKVLASTISDMFDPAVRERLRGIKTLDATAIEAVDTIQGLTRAITEPWSPSWQKDYLGKLNKANEVVKKYNVVGPASWLQMMSHLAAEKMVKAAGVTDESVIRTMASQFSKRTNGNYVAGQRPAILQGSIGHAAGLFQTWTFQVFQNLSRYIGEGDKAAMGAFLTAHTSFFGLKANPVFGAINAHIASRDAQNKDIYTRTAGAEMGDTLDFLLYGAPSAWSGVSLYTRGDLTPRTPVLLPTSFQDIPMVNAALRTYRGIAGIAEKVSAGAPVPQAFLEGVALSSINRPLAGLAQLMVGRSLFNAQGIGGQTITADINDQTAWTRLVGGRPFNEQKMLDSYYRNLAYEAKDSERVKVLGAAIRTKVSTGQEISPEEWSGFAENYYTSGGNVKNFSKFVQRQMATTNTNLSDRIYKTMHDSDHMNEWRVFMEAQDAGNEWTNSEAPQE